MAPARPALLKLALAVAVSLPRLCRAEADDRRHFEELLSWLNACIEGAGLGGRHPQLEETFDLTWADYGRSLAAKRSVADGELLALLPTACFIYDKDYGWQEDLQGLTPWQQASVFLARERAAGEESRWAPMMRMLPDSHPDLPKHWDASLIAQHLRGTDFLEHVEETRREQVREWEQVRAVVNISWEEFEWGYDTFFTRSTYWNGTEREGSVVPRRPGTSAVYPLYVLFAHGLPANVAYAFDRDLQALRITAAAPVREGGTFFIAYFERRGRQSRDILWKWGFTSDDALQVATVSVGPGDGFRGEPPQGREPGAEALPFALEPTMLDDGAAQAFLALLRARAANGAPLQLQSELPEEVLPYADPSTGWVYWWNQSSGESTWVLPGDDPDRPFYTPATSWLVEAAALQSALELLGAALWRYPQTLEEDDALLASVIADARVRHMVALRRSEKAVLTWWLWLVRGALELEGAPEEQVDVARVYAEPPPTLAPEGSKGRPGDEL